MVALRAHGHGGDELMRSGCAPDAAAEKADAFAARLAVGLGMLTALVLGWGLLDGPRPIEAALPDGLCAVAKGTFVYVGTRDERRCRWLVATESRGWAATELRDHSLMMRASWNAAQIKVDGQLFEI